MGKTLTERYEKEILSDNTGQCKQCKTCFFKDSYDHTKGVCGMYPHLKPSGIMKNVEQCEYYVEE